MTQQIILTVGLPASGKSTWAKGLDLSYKVICKDDIRLANPGLKESRVIEIRDETTRDYLAAGYSVVWADTNINLKHHDTARAIAKEFPGTEVVINDSFMDVPIEECIRRDALREGKAHVGEKVIRRFHNDWKKTKRSLYPVIEHNIYLPNAIMVDMDGTFALIHPGRSPYDASTADKDLPNVPVVTVVNHLARSGYQVIFCSGRQQKDEEPTRKHIEKYFTGSSYELYMRATGDSRGDDIVKVELYKGNIEGRFNILCVFDDRDRVVKAWREIGLTVFQVAEGDF